MSEMSVIDNIRLTFLYIEFYVFSPSRETKIIWRRTENRSAEIEKSFGAEKSADESQPF